MEALGNTLTTVFGVVALVTAALAGLQYGTLKTLRSSNQDLRDRVTDLDGKVKALLDQRDAALSEAKALGRVVTGEVYLTALAQSLDEHHGESMTALRDLSAAVRALHADHTDTRTVLRDLATAIRALQSSVGTSPPEEK